MSSSSQPLSNVIRWFESPALDKPYLKSPQPCKRGVHCDYRLPDSVTGELMPACCSGVHPGEEGTGRRLFPARTLDDGRRQPVCVRLTGASQGFYERRRLRMTWAEWCQKNGWAFTPALPGQPFPPLVRSPLGGKNSFQIPGPHPPAPISLSGTRSIERFAVSSRSGQCSPDCCCPTGISCHDRISPFSQEDESGFATPVLTTPLTSKGDFENLD